MATIRQVAKAAGVSIATVSRVLSNDPGFHVKEDTRTKVLQAAGELGYDIPDRTDKQYRFGCVLAHTTDKYADPYFSDIIQAMERECAASGASIVISKSYKDLEEQQGIGEFLAGQLDGIFLMEQVSQEALGQLRAHTPHLLFIDENQPDYVFDNVGYDQSVANWQVMHRLLGGGYRRIAMISGASPEEPMAHAIRFGIYTEALRQADIPYDPALVKDCSWDLDTCSDQTRELMAMESPPDVIFAGSDSLAQVVLGTLFSLGIRCPDDVGVIGFNNVELSSHMVPPLTTIDIPTVDIGRTAVRRMIQMISGDDPHVRRTLFPTRLIERGSLRKAAALSEGNQER